MWQKFKSWLQFNYQELLAFRDTPHTVALSFAIGVFLGILPFTGVLAAISIAWYLRLNKAAAILGAAITNTWLGLIVLGASMQVGALSLGLNSTAIEAQWRLFSDAFHWSNLFSSSFLRLMVPLMVGFLIITVLFTLLAYFLAIILLYLHRSQRR